LILATYTQVIEELASRRSGSTETSGWFAPTSSAHLFERWTSFARTTRGPSVGDGAPPHPGCLNELVTDDDRYLLAAIKLARQARDNGNHPFGALLVDADGKDVVESENTVVTGRDCTGHAETNVMRVASERFDPEFLRGCTLYTSTEPCAMCAGAIFWGNVRRVVFALREKDLRDIANQNPANATLAIPCREIFGRGDHEVEVSGPHVQEQARAVHEGFWT
jgi:tRNA(Arg) A34 adenosine deaminase TadA